MGLFKDTYCPNAERIAEKGFYIPSGLGIKEEEQEIIAKKLLEIF